MDNNISFESADVNRSERYLKLIQGVFFCIKLTTFSKTCVSKFINHYSAFCFWKKIQNLRLITELYAERERERERERGNVGKITGLNSISSIFVKVIPAALLKV